MISIAKANGITERSLINQLKERSGEVDRKVTAAVTEIIDNVKKTETKPYLNIRRSLTISDWNQLKFPKRR